MGVQKAEHQWVQSVESVGLAEASDEPAGSQAQWSPAPQSSEQAVVALPPVAVQTRQALPLRELVVQVRRPEEPGLPLVALALPQLVRLPQVREPQAQRASPQAEQPGSAQQARRLVRKQDACAPLWPQLLSLPFPIAPLALPRLLLPPGLAASCELFPRRPLESSSSAFSFP